MTRLALTHRSTASKSARSSLEAQAAAYTSSGPLPLPSPAPGPPTKSSSLGGSTTWQVEHVPVAATAREFYSRSMEASVQPGSPPWRSVATGDECCDDSGSAPHPLLPSSGGLGGCLLPQQQQRDAPCKGGQWHPRAHSASAISHRSAAHSRERFAVRRLVPERSPRSRRKHDIQRCAEIARSLVALAQNPRGPSATSSSLGLAVGSDVPHDSPTPHGRENDESPATHRGEPCGRRSS